MRFLPFSNKFLLSVFFGTLGEPAIVVVIYFFHEIFLPAPIKNSSKFPPSPRAASTAELSSTETHRARRGLWIARWEMSSLPSRTEGWHCLCLITLVPSWEQHHHPLLYEATIQLPLRKVSALQNRGSWRYCWDKRTWEQTWGKQHPPLSRMCWRVSLGEVP